MLIHCPLSCADKDMHSAASPSTNASATCRNTVRFCCSALWASPAVPEPNTCGGELIIISRFQYLSSILLKYPKMIWIHNYFFPRTACFAFNVTGSSFKHCLKFFFLFILAFHGVLFKSFEAVWLWSCTVSLKVPASLAALHLLSRCWLSR